MRKTKAAFATALVGGSLLLPAAQAREVAYDNTFCFSSTLTAITSSKELTVFGVELRGIVRSNTEDKTSDNETGHCVGANRITENHVVARGYCRLQSVNGDSYVGEYSLSGPPGSEGTWTIFHGTGKWAGIKGGGPYRTFTQGRPVTPGTGQACNRVWGKYTLPD